MPSNKTHKHILQGSARMPEGALIPQRSQRVALIQLPDVMNIGRWQRQCEEMDARTAYDLAGLLDPGSRLVTIMTYPPLIDVKDVSWVYVAWRGVLRWRHQAAEVTNLTLTDLQAMSPEWRRFMYPGRSYQWVMAHPSWVPGAQLPRRLAQVPIRYGLVDLDPAKDGEPPLWY